MSATVEMDRVANGRQLLVAAVGVSIVLFLIESFASFTSTDFMYAATPAVLAQYGGLYTVVPFLQAPLSVLPLVVVAKLTGNVNVFLAARVISCLLVIAAVLLPLLNRANRRFTEVSLVYISLCLTNFFIVSNGREAAGYAWALLFLSAAVTVTNAQFGSAALRGFIACACGALAACAKLYFIVALPGLLLYVLIKAWPVRFHVFAACSLGFAVGFLPIFFYLIQDFQSFWQWNVRYHELALADRLMTDPAAHWAEIANWGKEFALTMLIPVGFVVVGTTKAAEAGPAALRREVANIILLVFAAVMAISPLSLFAEYLAPLAFLLFLFSALWRGDEADRRLYLLFGGVLWCLQAGLMAQGLARMLVNDGVAVSHVLEAQSIARRVVTDGYRCERRAYTIEPLFLLGDAKFPPILASGPFAITMPRDGKPIVENDPVIKAQIEAWNPDVVIWGFFMKNARRNRTAIDMMVRDYARDRRFTVVSLGRVAGRELKLAYRPDCKSPVR